MSFRGMMVGFLSGLSNIVPWKQVQEIRMRILGFETYKRVTHSGYRFSNEFSRDSGRLFKAV